MLFMLNRVYLIFLLASFFFCRQKLTLMNSILMSLVFLLFNHMLMIVLRMLMLTMSSYILLYMNVRGLSRAGILLLFNPRTRWVTLLSDWTLLHDSTFGHQGHLPTTRPLLWVIRLLINVKTASCFLLPCRLRSLLYLIEQFILWVLIFISLGAHVMNNLSVLDSSDSVLYSRLLSHMSLNSNPVWMIVLSLLLQAWILLESASVV